MLNIDKNKPTPLYIQIYEDLKRQIISAELKAGERLSASRTLAQDYHISRNTVLTAYQQLESEGFVYSKAGSGFYVENIPDIDNYNKSQLEEEKNTSDLKEYRYDFRYGSIEPNIYQTRGFRKALKDALAALELKKSLQDCDPRGLLSLRQQIALHLREVRGVEADASQIVITGGHHYSIRLLSELFPAKDYSLLIEDPGHPDTRAVFAQAGYQIHPLSLDDNGLKVSELNAYDHSLVCITPSHQFPLGYILPIARRLQLLKWAVKSGSFLIEDDYDSELRYKEKPVPALYSLDHDDRVIYLGSFSKSLSPDLRVSYIVFPKCINPAFMVKDPLFNSSSSLLIQMTLQEYLASGEYRRRISSIRNTLRKKHNLILDFFKNNYGNKLKIYGDGGGTHFVIKLPLNQTLEQIIEVFHKEDVAVYPVSSFFLNENAEAEKMIMIGYSGITLDELPEYLEHLKNGIDSLLEK